MSSDMTIDQVDEYRANAQERWQDEINALGNMSSEEAFTHLIFIDQMLSMQYEGFNLKVTAAYENQYATDEGLAGDMQTQNTIIGNSENAIYNDNQILNSSTSSPEDKQNAQADKTQQQSTEYTAAQKENEDAAQLDADMHSGYYSDAVATQVEDSIGSLIPDSQAYMSPNANPDDPQYVTNTLNQQAGAWDATQPQMSNGNVTANGDPSEIDAENNQYQMLDDQFNGLSQQAGVQMKYQKGNFGMTQNICHTTDSNYVSQEKSMVQNEIAQ